MTFTLGQRSLDQLGQVHPRLRGVVMRAIGLTRQDFAVVQGLRTQAEADANLQKGTSRTTRSLHLMQSDGYAHAVDLAAFVNGKIDYSQPDLLYPPIAEAMRQAARDLQVTLRWGAVWDRKLNNLQGAPGVEAEAYAARFRAAQKRAPLMDWGHFELPADTPITTETKA